MNASASNSTLPIGLLAAAAFLSSAGARVVDPLLAPIAADFGRSVPTVAIIVSAFSIPYGLNQLLLGPIGDRVGKLRVMLAALVFYVAFTGSCALASNLETLALLRAAAGGASAGLIPVGLAYIGDQVPYADRQVALSRFLNGVVLAQVLAGPIGGLFAGGVGWRGVFLGLAAFAAAVAAVLAVRMRGLPQTRHVGRVFRPESYRQLSRDPIARRIMVASAIDGALLSGCFPYIAPYLHERFGLDYAAAGLVLAAFGIGALIYVRSVRALVSGLGETGLVLAGGVLLVFGTLLGAVAGAWPLFLLVQGALGLGYFMFHTVLQARATEVLPDARTTAVSFFAFMLLIGQAVGTIVMGRLVVALGYAGAFGIQSALIAVMTVWCAGFIRRSRPNEAVLP